MKTEFEGWVILDPDSEPMYDTAIEECTEQECINHFMANLFPKLDWFTMVLKGYSCVDFKMEIKQRINNAEGE